MPWVENADSVGKDDFDALILRISSGYGHDSSTAHETLARKPTWMQNSMLVCLVGLTHAQPDIRVVDRHKTTVRSQMLKAKS
jgi:hypothetical protein